MVANTGQVSDLLKPMKNLDVIIFHSATVIERLNHTEAEESSSAQDDTSMSALLKRGNKMYNQTKKNPPPSENQHKSRRFGMPKDSLSP